MTHQRLSELSGVGVAAISAIEAARSSPSLTNVLYVVDALGLTIDEAIEGAMANLGRVTVNRANSDDDEAVRALSAGLDSPAMEARLCTLEDGTEMSVPAQVNAFPTFCMVLSGSVKITRRGAEPVQLETGDAYHARPGQVTSWSGSTTEPAQVLVVADCSETRIDTEFDSRSKGAMPK